jgi:hypothetical protein
MQLAELAQNKVYGPLLCALSLIFWLPKRGRIDIYVMLDVGEKFINK